MPINKNPFLQCLIVLSAVILVDQLSKYEAAKYGLVSINTGVSFGLFGGNAQLVSTAILIAFSVLGILAAQHYTKLHPRVIGLFLGGALSNIIDRFFFTGVRDWLPVIVIPVKNNLADWAIFVAVLWLFWSELSKRPQEKRHH